MNPPREFPEPMTDEVLEVWKVQYQYTGNCQLPIGRSDLGRLIARLTKAESDLAAMTADRNDIIGVGEGMNDGPYPNCTDCGRRMVWQREPGYVVKHELSPGSWMCPNCVLDRLHSAEADLAAATTKIEELRQQLKGTKEARDAWKLNSENHAEERNAALSALTASQAEVERLKSGERCPFGETKACAKEACEERNRLRNDFASALARERALREALRGLADEIEKIHRAGCVSSEETGVALLGLMAMASHALAAAPSPACPSCERLRDVLRRVMAEFAYYDPDRRVSDVLSPALRSEADAALAHAEGTHKEKKQ